MESYSMLRSPNLLWSRCSMSDMGPEPACFPWEAGGRELIFTWNFTGDLNFPSVFFKGELNFGLALPLLVREEDLSLDLFVFENLVFVGVEDCIDFVLIVLPFS